MLFAYRLVWRVCPTVLQLALIAGIGGFAGLPAAASQVELLSRARPPFPYATGHSAAPALSADGRFVAFLSYAGNLAPGQVDSFAGSDCFLNDRATGITTLLTHRNGLPAVATESSCVYVQISADGRYVAFSSGGTDLVAGQTGSNQYYNLFLYDRLAGTTALVSHAPGAPTAGGNGSSLNPRLSQDGRYVVFESYARNLVAGLTDPTNSGPHLFLWDRSTDTTALVSHNHDGPTVTGEYGASFADISADGAYVTFDSLSRDLIPEVTFPSFPPNLSHAFLYERATGTIRLIDHASGAPTTPSDAGGYVQPGGLSADGRFLLFGSTSDDLVSGSGTPPQFASSLYLYDRQSGGVTLVTHKAGQPAAYSFTDSSFGLSADGRYAVFTSGALDLVAGETGPSGNLFLWDRTTGTTRLLSHAPGAPLAGTGGCASSQTDPSSQFGTSRIDASGDRVAFRSTATNLVPGQVDTAGSIDLFVWDRASDSNRLVSHNRTSIVTAVTATSSITALSGDGGTIAFDGPQSAIDSGAADPYLYFDVFAYDWPSQALTHVSHAASPSLTPTEGWIYDYDPAISLSTDGRFVVFLSDGVNLVPGQVDHLTDPDFDSGPNYDVFLADRTAGTTVLLTRDAAAPTHAVGGNEGVVSADGNYVAFVSAASNLVPGQVSSPSFYSVYLYDRVLGQTVLASHATGAVTTVANGYSSEPALSADGRYLAFLSSASNLVAGQVDTNNATDVFLYDRLSGTATLVSHVSGAPTTTGDTPWSYGPAISPDGRYVAFESGATHLVAGQVDTNGQDDVFLYDRLSGEVTLVSHASGAPTTAADGQSVLPLIHARLVVTDDGHVVFLSLASDLVAGQSGASFGVFLYDKTSDTTVLVSHTAGSATVPAAGKSILPAVSADGQTVAYLSQAADLVASQSDANGDYDAFVYDATTGDSTLASHAAVSLETAGDARCFDLSLSADGKTVAFSSTATDLVPGFVREHGFADVFVWHRDSGSVTLASHTVGSETTTGTDYSWRPAVSGDGRAVGFMSFAGDLVPGDANGAADVYVYTEAPPSATTGLFFTVSPCRLLDTRQNGGALHSGDSWALSAAGACGIPATAAALAVNLTAVQPTAAGFLTLHPADVQPSLASSLNFGAGQTRTNNAILPLAGGGGFAISPFVTGSGTVDVVVDVFGYFE
jgi:Tol biopolymer transport system component